MPDPDAMKVFMVVVDICVKIIAFLATLLIYIVQKKLAETCARLNALELMLAEKYVKKEDHSKVIARLAKEADDIDKSVSDKLDRITARIDNAPCRTRYSRTTKE